MSVSQDSSVQSTFVATLVDEWIRCGVTDAVICPGSRSTPLALAISARTEIRVHVRLDERSAGFYALGLALGSSRAPIVCTTSGTAAVELHPSVVEAHFARVPVIVCTADRPFELHDVGAPQSIDQTRLYSNVVRWYSEPGIPDGCDPSRRSWRSLADRAFYEATSGPIGPGPVHLNLSFREPLSFEPGLLPEASKSKGAPKTALHASSSIPSHVEVSSRSNWLGRRGVIVAGPGCGPVGDVLALAERLSWPVLADPRSRCRVRHRSVVASADSIFRSKIAIEALEPEVVLSLGAPWASRSIGEYVKRAGAAGAQVVAVDPWWRWVDPDRIVSDVYRSDPRAWLATALAVLSGDGDSRDDARLNTTEWLDTWKRVDLAAQEALDAALAQDGMDRDGALSEPSVARHLLGTVPAGTKVVVSSSMPIRDLECYTPALESPPQVISNRGANGIDGVCSTAIGVAASNTGPVVALVGDLAFFHDVSSLVTATVNPASSSCAIVVIDNRGGGIFSFLPQVDTVDEVRFERLFTTPQAPSVTDVASGFGVSASEVRTLGALDSELTAALDQDRLTVIRAIVPSVDENASLHVRINGFVSRAIESAL